VNYESRMNEIVLDSRRASCRELMAETQYDKAGEMNPARGFFPSRSVPPTHVSTKPRMTPLDRRRTMRRGNTTAKLPPEGMLICD